MSKLKLLSTTDVTPDLFNGKRSYAAAIWAIEICNKIIERHNAGDIVMVYENLIKPEFELRWFADGGLDGLYLKDDENTWTQLIGDIRGDGIPVIGEYHTIIRTVFTTILHL